MKFMTCNACRRIVQVNNTGICLCCQQHGIIPAEDAFENQSKEVQHDAIGKRIKQKDHLKKYRQASSGEEETEASSRHRPKRGRPRKKEA